MTTPGGYAVYAFASPPGFLCHELFPSAHLLHASPVDTTERVLARLPDGTRRFLFHVNLTMTARFPRDRARLVVALVRRGIEPLNHRVVDVSKRGLQSVLARLGLPTTAAQQRGDPREWVIVKTNYNAGGRQERKLRRGRRVRLGIAPASRIITRSRGYRVLRREDVPGAWWDDRSLFVERYVSNAEGRYFRAYVLHDRIVVSAITSARRVKKADPGLPRENHLFLRGSACAAVPDALRLLVERFIAEVSLDYGTLDVVADDRGAFHLVDVNTTPYWGRREQQSALIDHLRIG
jgi:hypothetical protein